MTREKRSALATIRTATGMTARQFGTLCGVSDALVILMENGKRAISAKVATSVMAATGADADALRKGRARDILGRPYTKTSYAGWCGAGAQDQVVDAFADRAAEMVRALVLASGSDSSGQRQPGCFHSVSFKLSMAIDEIAREAGLVDTANLHLRERKTAGTASLVDREEVEKRYGRSKSWPAICKALGTAEKVEVAETKAPVWCRLAGRAQMPNGKPTFAELVLVDWIEATVRKPGSSARALPVRPFQRSTLKLFAASVD